MGKLKSKVQNVTKTTKPKRTATAKPKPKPKKATGGDAKL